MGQIIIPSKVKADIALKEARQTEEKVDILVSNESESDEEEQVIADIKLDELKTANDFRDTDFNTQLDEIINSFSGKYKFRTSSGIAKELSFPPKVVKHLLDALESQGATKKFTKSDGKVVWGLTKFGQMLAESRERQNHSAAGS